MRWFASFYLTVALSLFVLLLDWIAQADIPWLSDGMRAVFPESIVNWWTIPLLVTGCYALVRIILQRVVAYTESAIDASPRESRSAWSRRRAALGMAAYRWFGNPTGRWLAPFALVASVVAGLAWLVRGTMYLQGGFDVDEDWPVVLGLSFLALYALTLDMAMLFPDRPQRLRPEPEPDPDPILDLPDSPDEPPAPAGTPPKNRGRFGRRFTKAAKPATP